MVKFDFLLRGVYKSINNPVILLEQRLTCSRKRWSAHKVQLLRLRCRMGVLWWFFAMYGVFRKYILWSYDKLCFCCMVKLLYARCI